MKDVTSVPSPGACVLSGGSRSACSTINGPGGTILCSTCGRYNMPLGSELAAQLRDQHRLIRDLVKDLISAGRTEPLPFCALAVVPEMRNEVRYLGPANQHTTRVVLGREPKEGPRIKLDISFGTLREGEHTSEPPGFLLDSPWLTKSMDAGVAQAVQKLSKAGFHYVGYGPETDEVRYLFDFTKMEKVQGSGIVLGAHAALTIFK